MNVTINGVTLNDEQSVTLYTAIIHADKEVARLSPYPELTSAHRARIAELLRFMERNDHAPAH